MAQVKLQNLNKIYKNGFHAVHDVCLDIQDGEFMVLVGPSGCAKSTTLRMMAGLESITTGELIIGDKKCNDIPPKDRGIAMVFQNFALYPHRSVKGNIEYPLKIMKLNNKLIDEKIRWITNLLGIQPLLNRKIRNLVVGKHKGLHSPEH